MVGFWYKGWMVFLVFVGAIERAEQSRNVDAAQHLRAGMTRQQVLEIMGPPDIDYRPQWNHWLYGIDVDLDNIVSAGGLMNPIPVRLRLFVYDDDDVVVRWGSDDKVVLVNRPEKLPAPAQFKQMLDGYLFVRAVYDLLCRPEA